MKKVVATILFFACLTCFSQEVQKRQITSAQMDSIFSKWDTSDKPGIAVGVISDGKMIFTKGYGLANLEHKIPITTETRFPIGDIAKEFTVYALLLLEQRGHLSLQDDIRKYLPVLPDLGKRVAIKDLIYHRSGMRDIVIAKAL